MTRDPQTTPVFRTNNFDLLRLLAASQVLFFHARTHLELNYDSWTDAFWYFRGVPVFFVISGYLISASWERGAGNAAYLQNRLLRILPGLWTCIAVTVVVATAFGFDFLHPTAVIWFFAQLVGLIYTPGFLADFGFGSYNGSLWTIPVELQFYFVLPLFYLVAERIEVSVDRVLIAAFVVFSVIGLAILVLFPDMLTPQETRLAKLLRYCFFTHFYVFLAGVLLQRLAVYRSPLIAGKGLLWSIAYAGLVRLLPSGPVTEYALMLVLAITVVSLAYTLPDLASRLLRGNDVSYGVYIYHGLLLDIMVEIGAVGSTVHLLIVAVGTFAVATVSWFVVERPFLRRKRSTLHAA
jgi:peptidoglycan/LPS O-acetylase OafA/YrhL